MYLILAAFLAANTFASDKIVGGKDVARNSPLMKSTLALISKSKGKLRVICSGTVIHPHVVLSAAHCVDQIVSSELYVANGKDPLKNSKRFKIKAVKYFKPQYSFDAMELVEDIAILVTEKAMVDYQAVKIGAPTDISEATKFIQIGYGFRMWEPSTYEYPEYGLLQGLSKGVFESFDRHILNIDTDAASGVMSGDSGGPLFVKQQGQLVLHGVLSQGGPSGDGQEATYAHPYFFSNWLQCSYPDLRLEHASKDQFPCDGATPVSAADLPAHNRKQCQLFKAGWDLLPSDGVCWPRTQTSCQDLANETSGDVFWDLETLKCEIKK